MAFTKATEAAPALPAGPVDFDKLSAALAAGKSGEEAIEAAIKNNPVPQAVKIDVQDTSNVQPEVVLAATVKE